MRKFVAPLTGLAIFVYGLMKIDDAIYTIVDTSDVMFGLVLLVLGALLLSVEMSRW